METYRIRYLAGENPTPALELVCKFMGVGLREARELVGTRGVILDKVSAAEARRVAERFAAIGAEVEIEQIWRHAYAYNPTDPTRGDQVIQRLRAGAGELVIDEGQLGGVVEGEPMLFTDEHLTERRVLVEFERWRARELQLADSEIAIVEALSERDLALEAKLREDPGDLATHLIYSDWLQTRGDARGQLIALQHACEQARASEARGAKGSKGSKLALLEARERDLLERHASHLFGPLRPAAEAVVVRWTRGFIDAAFVGVGQGRAILTPLQTLTDLLRLPIAARMTSLGVTSALLGRRQLEPTLCESEVVACLRELELGDHVAMTGSAGRAHSARTTRSLTRLWSHLRKLHRLILHSDQPPLHELHSATLEHLELHMNGLRDSSSRRFVPGRLPRLRTLTLDFVNADRISPAAFADLLGLSELDGVTELTLRLPNHPVPFALADVLASVPRLSTLASLDLSRCVVDERAMQAIIRAQDRGRLPDGLLMPTLMPAPA